MKKSFSSLACMSYSLSEIAECAASFGLAVEIRLNNDGTICGITSEDEILEIIDKYKIKITNLGTSVALTDYEPEKIETAKKAISLAKVVGAKGIRIFLGRFIQFFSQGWEQNYDGIIKSLKEICLFGEKEGVEIWIETHNSFSTGKVLKKLIEDVGFSNLKIIWDIIHPIEQDESPEDTLRYLDGKISHIHIKDGVRSDNKDKVDYIYTKLGEGELPIEHILSLLHKNGYDGYLSLEWENEWRSEIKESYSSLSELLTFYNEFMDKKISAIL